MPDHLRSTYSIKDIAHVFGSEDGFLLQNGAITGSVNGGYIRTVVLPKSSDTPTVQFKAFLHGIIETVDMKVDIISMHSTVGQNLDLDLEYTVVGSGDNFDTKAQEAVLNETPTTPDVAFDRFVVSFTIPQENISEDSALEMRLTRNVGAETGDYEIWGVIIYQVI